MIGPRDHLARVADIPCVLCEWLELGQTPAAVHHIESVRDELSDYLTLPLCPEHHQGATGVHGLSRREFERRYKVGQYEMLALVIRRL